MWHIVCSTTRPMVAFPRSSKTLIFVAPRSVPDADDTVTEVLRPGSKTKRIPRVRAHTPPKPRTSHEGELPSIMVTQDSWVPPTPTQVTRFEKTIVRKSAPARARLTRHAE